MTQLFTTTQKAMGVANDVYVLLSEVVLLSNTDLLRLC